MVGVWFLRVMMPKVANFERSARLVRLVECAVGPQARHHSSVGTDVEPLPLAQIIDPHPIPRRAVTPTVDAEALTYAIVFLALPAVACGELF